MVSWSTAALSNILRIYHLLRYPYLARHLTYYHNGIQSNVFPLSYTSSSPLTPRQVVTPEQWTAARDALLVKEKKYFRDGEALVAERQSLPVTVVPKEYSFNTGHGTTTLQGLFGGKSQLIVYHYMFEPTANDGCPGCAFMVANFPDLRHLEDKDTALVVISRAPIEKITAFKEKNFWSFPWVSSEGGSFNYDFGATIAEGEAVVGDEMNGNNHPAGDQPGFTVFKLHEGRVYRTYSAFNYVDALMATWTYLDMTLGGRQEGPRGPAEFMLPSQYHAAGRG